MSFKSQHSRISFQSFVTNGYVPPVWFVNGFVALSKGSYDHSLYDEYFGGEVLSQIVISLPDENFEVIELRQFQNAFKQLKVLETSSLEKKISKAEASYSGLVGNRGKSFEPKPEKAHVEIQRLLKVGEHKYYQLTYVKGKIGYCVKMEENVQLPKQESEVVLHRKSNPR